MTNECTLTDQELMNKIDSINGALCKSGGKSWCLSVPPDVNNDPDLLIAELVKRFERAKLSKEAAKVWISWGTHFTFQRLTAVKPELFEYNGGVAYLNNGNAECIILPYFSELLGLKEGECKAFEIREVYG